MNTNMANFTVRDATQIPELVLNILSFADMGSLFAAARVCRLWYPNALDGIWRDCVLFDLIQTFCPLTYDEADKTWDFGGYGNWDRFMQHARRVVHLRHDDKTPRDWHHIPRTSFLAFGAIMTMESHFPVGTDPIFFPNIRTIYVNCCYSASLLQMIPFVLRATRLAEIHVRFPAGFWTTSSFRPFHTLARALPITVGRIRLHIKNKGAVTPDLYDFIKLLKCRTTLTQLGFEEQVLSLKTAETLGQFDALRILEFGIENDMALEPLFATLAHVTPNLQDLRLHTCNFFGERLLFEIFRPTFHLAQLTTFFILHNFTIILTEDDILSMGRAWPLLETLHLPSSTSMDTDDHPGIPLIWLGTFVRSLPRLRALSVYFDNFDNLSPTAYTIPRFPQLQTLAVGGSNTNATGKLDEVVEFLGRICPPGVAIMSDLWYRPKLQSAFEPLPEEDWMPFWNDVSALVKVVHRAEAGVVQRARPSSGGQVSDPFAW